MNIYLLSATKTAWITNSLIVKNMPVRGIIGLADASLLSNPDEYCNYSTLCQEEGADYIPLSSYDLKSSETMEILRNLDIDVLVVTSWQRLVPEWLISHCKVGVIGNHGSPQGICKGRGRSPQNWALMLNHPTFEISIFWIDPGIDSGNIIDTRKISYAQTDDITTSYIKIGTAVADMFIEHYRNGNIEKKYGVPQDEEQCSYLPQRIYEDGMIDWERSCYDIYYFVRALTKPYPGAYTKLNGQDIHIWRVIPIHGSLPNEKLYRKGEIVCILPDNQWLVKCGEGCLLICEYTFMNNDISYMIKKGTVFESDNFQLQIQRIMDRHKEKYDYPLSNMIINCIKETSSDKEEY